MDNRDKCQKPYAGLPFLLWITLDKAQTIGGFIHNAVHNSAPSAQRALKRYKGQNSHLFSIRAFRGKILPTEDKTLPRKN